MPLGAIITGDIVNSTMLLHDKEKRLKRSLIGIFEEYKYEFFRGDSFQVYVKDISMALKIVLKGKAIARSFGSLHDIKASIGIGDIKTPVRSLNISVGESFILSGRAFDELANEVRLNIKSFKSENDPVNAALRIIAYFCDYIFQQLTPKQAAVVNELLSGHTQVQSAAKLRITQATLSKHAQSAGWGKIQRLLDEYQGIIIQFK